jgi:hypothetical protein
MAKIWKKVSVTDVTEATGTVEVVNDEFETVLYTGNGSTQTINLTNIDSGVDFVWMKGRDFTVNNIVTDSIRNSTLFTNLRIEERVSTVTLNTTSFSLNGSSDGENTSSQTYVAWCASLPNYNPSNTAGTITSETKSNSFMSVGTYTGNTTAGATVGHGLTQAPEMVIIKRRDTNLGWYIYHKDLAITELLKLEETAGAATSRTEWNSTAPNSSVITLGADITVNQNFLSFIALTSVAGKCKVGSYVGTGSAGNAITGIGFEPAWLLVKRTDSTGDWQITDATRGGDKNLEPNTANTETSGFGTTFDSDGFTLQATNQMNASGGTYIYLAIAKNIPKTVNTLKATFAAETEAPSGIKLVDNGQTLSEDTVSFDGSKFTKTFTNLGMGEAKFRQERLSVGKGVKLLDIRATVEKKTAGISPDAPIIDNADSLDNLEYVDGVTIV